MDESPVRAGFPEGDLDFEIDLRAFPEAEPMFAYVDDYASRAVPLVGMVAAGELVIPDRPQYIWLKAGDRRCVLLRANRQDAPNGIATFRTLTCGEFCVEIYHVRPDGGSEVIYQDDFCCK